MKRLIAAAALALAGLGAALGAPSAHADEGHYIANLEHSGWGYSGQKSLYLQLGYRVCADWNSGYTKGQIWNEVYYQNPQVNFVDYGAAQRLVNEAIAELC
jgi:hypothetical protein